MTALGLRFFFAIPDIFPSPLTPSSVIARTEEDALPSSVVFLPQWFSFLCFFISFIFTYALDTLGRIPPAL